MKMIFENKADIVNLDAEDLYLAGRIYNLEPFAMEETDGCEYFALSLPFHSFALLCNLKWPCVVLVN